jgi:intron-binding protein aquarius
MTIDVSVSLPIRTQLIDFIVGAFQSLDHGLVRKECAPLVSISIWHNFHSDAVRERKLEQSVVLKKAWRAAAKRFDAADEAAKSRLTFERSWLYTLILDFLDKIYAAENVKAEECLIYCERFIEFLSDLQSQLPTRRYVNALLHDSQLLVAVQLSPTYQQISHGLFRDLCALLSHYTYFPIDDQSCQQYTSVEYRKLHDSRLLEAQRIAMKEFPEKLKVLALSNLGSLDKRQEIEPLLDTLTDDELSHFCDSLRLRTRYPESSLVVQDRPFVLEVLMNALERRTTLQDSMKKMAILPTEAILYEDSFTRNSEYDGSRPLATPKLNLQYLTMGDFLWRSFILHRAESFFEIRTHIEDTVKRMQPRGTGVTTRFEGFARLALPIAKPAILEVVPAKVGEFHPALVRTEVILDVQRLNAAVRREWETLRQDDVVYLIGVHADSDPLAISNGHTCSSSAQKLGIKYVRCAEVLQVQDDKGRPLRDQQMAPVDEYAARVRQRRLVLKLDVAAYQEDMRRAKTGRPDVYESINLLVRRRARENNFKPILESIRHLTLSDVPAPSWLREVFLGYGDPAGATYQRLSNRLKSIDYRDTFLDWSHLIESFPGKTIEPAEEAQSSFGPPYILETVTQMVQEEAPRPSKKRRRDQDRHGQSLYIQASQHRPLSY